MTLYIPRAGKLWQVMWLKLLKIGKEKINGEANLNDLMLIKSYERI